MVVGIILAARTPYLGRATAAIGGLFGAPRAALGRKRRGERVKDVELAAVEAAADHERFAAERVRSAAETLFRDVQAAWDARDSERLATLLGPDLLAEWERRLADFDAKGWHSRAEVLGAVNVEYVGLANREGESDDRAVVLIEAVLRAYVQDKDGNVILRKDEQDDVMRLSQYWTLGARGEGWALLSIEELDEGRHNLTDPLVTTPWDDDQRIRDEAVIETATADGVPAGFSPAGLPDLDFADDARAAALDLSLADARFAPDVLEASARRAVAAWAEAVDGDDRALAELATEPAIRQLLHQGDESRKQRVVVRGPRVERFALIRLDAASEPATMTVQIDLEEALRPGPGHGGGPVRQPRRGRDLHRALDARPRRGRDDPVEDRLRECDGRGVGSVGHLETARWATTVVTCVLLLAGCGSCLAASATEGSLPTVSSAGHAASAKYPEPSSTSSTEVTPSLPRLG